MGVLIIGRSRYCAKDERKGKRLVFDITFVKEDVLERYQALHQSTKHILGEIRYEYIDEYLEVCAILDDIAQKYLSK